jgi:hypothetical protein
MEATEVRRLNWGFSKPFKDADGFAALNIE